MWSHGSPATRAPRTRRWSISSLRIAARLDATAAQVALAWLLAQQPWLAPIPGTRKLARLEENLAAADLELPAADLEEITAVSAALTLEGARYPEALQKLIDG